jgi:RNA polymerase sigma-70 factor (ECF subfamily)
MLEVHQVLIPHPMGTEALTGVGREAHVRRLVQAYFEVVWRVLRRLGVAPDALDDATQQVFLVATRRLDEIDVTRERQYLLGIAVRVASETRRARSRRREVADDDADRHVDPTPSPDELLDRKRARALLDEVLASMPLDLRAAFTMFELEGMSLPEVGAVLGIPTGTATSRLRRAREHFQASVRKLSETRGGHHD